MRYIAAVLVYMFISGMVGAIGHNSYHERCGTSGQLSVATAAELLLWPIAIGFAAKVNPSTFQKTECREK
jgi:hypothetical protein